MSNHLPQPVPSHHCRVAIIGAGPAGLLAAQQLSAAGIAVQVFDAMPTAARKFLIAGRGGLNLTHSEDFAPFVQRYGSAADWLAPMLQRWGRDAVRAWAHDLGCPTFIGTSGRVFPASMKAAPLLRAWLQRLRQPTAAGSVPVVFQMRWRWLGWAEDGKALRFATPEGEQTVQADAVLLALGGASWPRLGSTGDWVEILRAQGVALRDLQAANCGFDAAGRSGSGWTARLAEHAGQPFKNIALRWQAEDGAGQARRGECVLTATGLEGSVLYAASAALRESINASGSACLYMNLLPEHSAAQVLQALQAPRQGQSLSTVLKKRFKLDALKIALLYELLSPEQLQAPQALAAALQNLPIALRQARPVAEAISSAGGVAQAAVDENLMLQALPGVFCAGEMLDWEAPTGGYLLTACMATAQQAAAGIQQHLAASKK
ncbi:MAG: TIGR03862 family flavoprotein [Brachymonas sp.]|jgi:uncharacterized flavoprotein (TIGR03862 family)